MKTTLIKILLICGILSSVLYISMDIIAGLMYKGYSFSSQAISELSAVGAPTRPFWIVASIPYVLLLMAFGIGVWLSAKKRNLKITGIMLTIWGALGIVWLFFPMHMRGYIGSTTDTMHMVLSAVTVLLITFFIAFGSGADGKSFRIYSILSILLMLAFGSLVGMQAPAVAAQLPTPWMGIEERVSVYLPMVWVALLAFILLKKNSQASYS